MLFSSWYRFFFRKKNLCVSSMRDERMCLQFHGMWVFLLILTLGTGCQGQVDDNGGGPSRLFKPPFPATTVEVTPKFKVRKWSAHAVH